MPRNTVSTNSGTSPWLMAQCLQLNGQLVFALSKIPIPRSFLLESDAWHAGVSDSRILGPLSPNIATVRMWLVLPIQYGLQS